MTQRACGQCADSGSSGSRWTSRAQSLKSGSQKRSYPPQGSTSAGTEQHQSRQQSRTMPPSCSRPPATITPRDAGE
uniref:Uncharacterized protein n=1 Tax=Knipowitschia caucasica TaxID=637954 RepID=A0AAV2JDF5_KNICA